MFNNKQSNDYPQAHYITTDEPVDAVILGTGMVTSNSQLKRLYKQKAVHIEMAQEVTGIRIGQRRLIYGVSEIHHEAMDIIPLEPFQRRRVKIKTTRDWQEVDISLVAIYGCVLR